MDLGLSESKCLQLETAQDQGSWHRHNPVMNQKLLMGLSATDLLTRCTPADSKMLSLTLSLLIIILSKKQIIFTIKCALSGPIFLLSILQFSSYGVCDGQKVTLGQVFSEYFGFPCQFAFHRLLHNHHHIWSGADAIGQKVATVPSGLGLSPRKKHHPVSRNYIKGTSNCSSWTWEPIVGSLSLRQTLPSICLHQVQFQKIFFIGWYGVM
jgi:hypothetical protein